MLSSLFLTIKENAANLIKLKLIELSNKLDQIEKNYPEKNDDHETKKQIINEEFDKTLFLLKIKDKPIVLGAYKNLEEAKFFYFYFGSRMTLSLEKISDFLEVAEESNIPLETYNNLLTNTNFNPKTWN